jgi:hypothetical protein
MLFDLLISLINLMTHNIQPPRNKKISLFKSIGQHHSKGLFPLGCWKYTLYYDHNLA